MLDTNIVSNLRRKRPHPALAQWIARTDSRELRTTVVTIIQIQCGIERVRSSDDAFAREIEKWLEALLAASELNVLTITVEASRLLGKMYETPVLRHFIRTDPNARAAATSADLAIAAISIANGCTVATETTKHFLQIDKVFPLAGLFNPIDPVWHVARREPA